MMPPSDDLDGPLQTALSWPMLVGSGETWSSAPSASTGPNEDFLTMLVVDGDRPSATDASGPADPVGALSLPQNHRRFQLHLSDPTLRLDVLGSDLVARFSHGRTIPHPRRVSPDAARRTSRSPLRIAPSRTGSMRSLRPRPRSLTTSRRRSARGSWPMRCPPTRIRRCSWSMKWGFSLMAPMRRTCCFT